MIVEHRPTETYLERVEIHPGYQGRGMGSQLIGQLLREAAGRGLPVVLDVLDINHGARALYRRLGFQNVNRHGANNIRIRMRWTPQPPTDLMHTS
ncbi:GNAT family N-acetyltransferase [Micromonospora sp. NPDC005206]|uniref:GNAT family N-acetyltransferase n=1 Tax=Micromonospora sp. NPDC005206 TaxID=3157022 RepID=UPI0033AD57A1